VNPIKQSGHAGMDVGRLFARYLRCSKAGRGDPEAALAFLHGQPWNCIEALDKEFKAKSAIAPMGIGAYAGSQGPVATDLAAYVRPRVIIGKLPHLRATPFNTRIVTGIGGARGEWVVAGEPIPVSYGSFTLADALPIAKVSTIVVSSNELLRNSSPAAEMVLAADVGGALVQTTDLAFIDPSSGATASRPESVTYGSPQHESSGPSLDAIDADLKLLVLDLLNAGMTLETATWIVSPVTAASLAAMRGTGGAPAFPGVSVTGGELLGLPCITSSALNATGSPGERSIVLLESGQVDLADDNGGELDITEEASVQLDDAPGTGAQSLVSLWQNGMTGIKAARYLNWRRRHDGVASVLRGVAF
jgi:hypothetical protein